MKQTQFSIKNLTPHQCDEFMGFIYAKFNSHHLTLQEKPYTFYVKIECIEIKKMSLLRFVPPKIDKMIKISIEHNYCSDDFLIGILENEFWDIPSQTKTGIEFINIELTEQ